MTPNEPANGPRPYGSDVLCDHTLRVKVHAHNARGRSVGALDVGLGHRVVHEARPDRVRHLILAALIALLRKKAAVPAVGRDPAVRPIVRVDGEHGADFLFLERGYGFVRRVVRHK